MTSPSLVPVASMAPRFSSLRRFAFGLALSAACVGSAVAQCQWIPGLGFDLTGSSTASSSVSAMVVLANGDLIAGGAFDRIGGVPVSNIARWNGSAWSALGSGIDGPVGSLALEANGHVIAAGTFTTAGGVPANNIARWDGATWTSLGAGVGGSYGATAATVLTNGNLLAVSVANPNNIQLWNGASWSVIGAPSANESAYCAAALPNGDAVIGGTFWNFNGIAASSIIRWSSATSSWLPMGNIHVFFTPSVYSVAVLPGGTIVAGGNNLLGGTMAAWNGVSWSTMACPIVPSTNQVLPNGHLLATGSTFAYYPTMIEWDGTGWATLASLPLQNEIFCAAKLPNGNYIAGGVFTSIGGAAANGIARNACPIVGAASATNYGSSCGIGVATLYEHFTTGTAFDLSQSTLRLDFNGYAYQVSHAPGTPTIISTIAPALPLTDDSLSNAISLPFTIPYPGGSTNQILVGSNGFVYLQPGSDASAFYGNVAGLLSGTPRWAPMWGDQDPGPTGGGSVHVDVDLSNQEVRVTWLNVQEYGAPGNPSTIQLVAAANGDVEYRYLQCAASVSVLAGWSPGAGAVDPLTVDLSAAGPFVCAPDSLPMQHAAAARPVTGTTISLDTTLVPANSLLGATILGTTQFNPGIDLGSLGMPGCYAYASLDVFATAIPSVPSFSYALSIPNNLALVGVRVYTQGLALAVGFNAFGFLTTNGVDLLLGDM